MSASRTSKGGLTKKEAAFVREYLSDVDMDGSKAVIRAGYKVGSAQNASKIAYNLIRNQKVAKAIQDAMDKRAKRLEITADNVLQEIAKLAFANLQNCYDEDGQLIPPHKLPPEVAASLTEVYEEHFSSDNENRPMIKRRYKFVDKGVNLERLGKHLKLFTDKVEHSGGVNVTFSMDYGKIDPD